jgi:hypothetical protein
MSTTGPRAGSRAAVVRVVGVMAAAVAMALALVGTAAAAPSSPSGGDAIYQIEISANVPGSQGGGSWFWLELDRDGSGIYAGSDCAHGSSASSARGALTWEQRGDHLLIDGIQSGDLPPFAYEPTIVPAAYGHYVETFEQVFPTLTAFLTSVGADVSNGTVQVQVAP